MDTDDKWHIRVFHKGAFERFSLHPGMEFDTAEAALTYIRARMPLFTSWPALKVAQHEADNSHIYFIRNGRLCTHSRSEGLKEVG